MDLEDWGYYRSDGQSGEGFKINYVKVVSYRPGMRLGVVSCRLDSDEPNDPTRFPVADLERWRAL